MRQTAASTPHRQSTTHIAITPVAGGFTVRIDGQAVQFCADELDAHHWGKHAFEAVNQGLHGAKPVARAMRRLCLNATRYNLHR